MKLALRIGYRYLVVDEKVALDILRDCQILDLEYLDGDNVWVASDKPPSSLDVIDPSKVLTRTQYDEARDRVEAERQAREAAIDVMHAAE